MTEQTGFVNINCSFSGPTPVSCATCVSLRRATSPTTRYRTIPYQTIPNHKIPYHTKPYQTIQYHTIPYQTIPYHTIPYHTIPHTIPYTIPTSGQDPDLYVFEPPRSASGSVIYLYGSGSGSFRQQAKKWRKTFISVLWNLLFEELCKCTFKKE